MGIHVFHKKHQFLKKWSHMIELLILLGIDMTSVLCTMNA